MKLLRWPAVAILCLHVAVSSLRAAEPATGWRGNGTGLWPDAKVPTEWHRIPHGAMEGLRASAARPKGAEPGDAPLVEKGLVRDWLVIGPFAVTDSVRDFDQDLLGGESSAEPSPGDKVAEREWKTAAVPPDDIMVFGTAELPWLDAAKVVGFARNQFAYAHTYLYSPRGGKARGVVDHGHGLKAWLNGRQVYRSPDRGTALGSYVAISTHELKHLDQPSPRLDIELRPGWNRLLLKLSTSNKEDFTDLRCCLRISDPPDVPYETKNILWMTKLPGRSTSTPILVGDRLFVMAEPDELLCLDKNTGRILWSAAINYYEALPADERKSNPAYAERVDPLVAKLKESTSAKDRVNLRAEIQKQLVEIDRAKFALAADGHFEAHFGIVGFTMPTPVCDGRHVYVWSGMGVAASYDLDGRRRWITRVAQSELTYGSSPALVDGVLVVFLNGLFGLDAATGKLLWEQHRVQRNVGALLGATLAGQNVVVCQRGEVVRPSDGKLLFRPREATSSGDTGWSPPVILGNTVYQPRYGVTSLSVLDFSEAEGDRFEPKVISEIGLPGEVSRLADGKWIDRWTAGSPLVWQGIAYETDIYHWLYAVDLASGKMLYRRELELEGLMHYNSVPVAASPALIGGHVFVCDNQGTTLVLEPGREFKLVARNRIATQLERTWPIPAQETLAYAPPITDGKRLYLRGEAYLYCIADE